MNKLKTLFFENSIYLGVLGYLFFKKDEGVIGPLRVGVDDELIKEAISFRNQQNEIRAPYLVSESQRVIEHELKIDERSAHFLVQKNKQIKAYIRLTPGPFEMSRLISSKNFNKREYQNYYEFSRLCVDNKISYKSYYAILLLLKAGLWLFSKQKADGIIGICKLNRIRFFDQFSLRPEYPVSFYNENRNGYYFIIKGSKENVLAQIYKLMFQVFRRQFKWRINYENRKIKRIP